MNEPSYCNTVDFVYIGKNLPKYAVASIEIANKTSGIKTHLIANSSVRKNIKKKHLNFTAIEDFYDKEFFLEASKKLSSDKNFRNGFWLKSLERFFVVNQFAKYAGKETIFHAELDQILFEIDKLIAQIEKTKRHGLFVPFHSKTSAVASVLYINDISALDSLLKAASEGELFNNEMALIARWAKLNPERIFGLPTLATEIKGSSQILPSKITQLTKYELDGVVDAAQIGQWIAGIDPKNVSISKIPRTKFVDKPSPWLLTEQNLNEIQLNLSNDNKSLSIEYRNDKIRLYNLHIHAKIHHTLLSSKYSIKTLVQISNLEKKHYIKGTRLTQIIAYLKKLLITINSDPGRLLVEIRWRLKAALKLRPSSYPFISGDTFRSFSDHKWEKNNKQIKSKDVKSGDIIFCESEFYLELCEKILSHVAIPTIVLLGNSDKNHNLREIEPPLLAIAPKIFAQNLITEIADYHILPIGLENAWRSRNGKLNLKKVQYASSTNRIFRVMWGFNASTNLEVRLPAEEALEKSNVTDRIKNVTPKKHQTLLTKYGFIASPPGNGLDTHRTWEAMYFRCIPIIIRSYMAEVYQELGLPVYILDSYEELKYVDEPFLEKFYNSSLDKFENNALFHDFWMERIIGENH